MESRRGELVVVIGAALLFFGPTLNFIDIEGPGGSISGSGYDLEEGSSYVLAGVVALIGVAMAWLLKGGGRKAGGVVIVLAGAFAAYAGFVDAFTDPEGVTSEISVSHGIGTYVVLAAGLIVLIGGALILKSEAPASTPPSEPPPVA